MVPSKLCRKCDSWKGVTEFSAHKAKGTQAWCRVCMSVWSKQNRNGYRGREAHLRVRYGLTSEAYDALLQSQNGRCAICRGANVRGTALFVDHDHATGRVRGLLCDGCNRGLGFFKDSPERMRAGADYIERTQ